MDTTRTVKYLPNILSSLGRFAIPLHRKDRWFRVVCAANKRKRPVSLVSRLSKTERNPRSQTWKENQK
jgi:hypothetical protein